MNTVELDLTRTASAVNGEAAHAGGLTRGVLQANIRWFIRVRWWIVGAFALAGSVAAAVPDLPRALGLVPRLDWLLVLAVWLSLANVVFMHAGRKRTELSRTVLLAQLWTQIVVDLLVVTALVHCVGSVCTGLAYLYLLHITLACIFLPRRHSFLVTLVAAALYLSCVALEVTGRLPMTCVLAGCRHDLLSRTVLFAMSACGVWLAVWYFCSRLAESVQERDQQLSDANGKLQQASKETTRQVLQTTHDLKAPFTGIQSNIAVLRMRHWAAMPEDARALLERIEVRSRTLAERIKNILVLGELRQNAAADADGCCRLDEALDQAFSNVADRSRQRAIELKRESCTARVRGSVRLLGTLFSNVLANAVNYSPAGAVVTVTCTVGDHAVVVKITDEGIGIPQEDLPRIFDPYFRTSQAAEFNAESTGLGLAIVREIAGTLKLRMRVMSEVGRGTVVEVFVPRAECETEERDGHG